MEPYIVGIVSLFLGYVSSRFANRRIRGIFPHIGLFAVLALVAVVLIFVGQWLSKPSPPPPDQHAGQWLEKYKEGETDTYAIATVGYNSSGNYLDFSGNAYDSNSNIIGRWHTIQSRLDRDQYDYLFEGESWNRDPSKHGLRKGVGGIFFDSSSHGRGKFLSIRDDHEPRDCELHKILDEDAARQSIKDPKGLVQKLTSDPMYFNKITSPR